MADKQARDVEAMQLQRAQLRRDLVECCERAVLHAIDHPAQTKPCDYFSDLRSRNMTADRLAILREEKSVPGFALDQKGRACLRMQEAIGDGSLWQVEARFCEGPEVKEAAHYVRKRTLADMSSDNPMPDEIFIDETRESEDEPSLAPVTNEERALLAHLEEAGEDEDEEEPFQSSLPPVTNRERALLSHPHRKIQDSAPNAKRPKRG